MHVQFRIFGAVWHKNICEGGLETKTEKHLIRHIQSKMKEFDIKLVESLLDGVKSIVKSMGDNGVCFLFK